MPAIDKKHNIRHLQHLFRYLKPYKVLLAIVILAILVIAASFLLLSRSVAYVIDYGLSHNNHQMLDRALLYFFYLAIIFALATSIRFFAVNLLGELVIRDIRRDIHQQTLRLSPSFYENNKAGEIIARLTTDTTLLQAVIGSSLAIAVRNMTLLIGSFAMLVMASPKLTLFIGLVIPIIIIPILFFGRKMRHMARVAQDKVAALTSASEETIAHIKTIQSYAHEAIEIDNFAVKLTQSVNASLARIKVRAILIFCVITLIFTSIALVLWVGGQDVISGSLSGGQLSSFVILSIICASALAALTEVTNDLQKAAGASERVIEFLQIQPEIREASGAYQLQADLKNQIIFKEVTFYYPSKPDKAALKDVSFAVPHGKMVALVGESGAGKSTVFQLLLRFYDIQNGQILYGDTDIKKLKLQDLRSQFAYVSQEPVIFSSSVYENILYGKPTASMAEVRQAAEDAAALDFIEKLPAKFDTFLGEKGVRISGGQKQRIAIARAILKNPKVLLLDEATSALDSTNEQLIQNALNRLIENKTTIVIAHRLSTITSASLIIVMKDGKIVESGTHQELMKQQSEYYRLMQSSVYTLPKNSS